VETDGKEVKAMLCGRGEWEGEMEREMGEMESSTISVILL